MPMFLRWSFYLGTALTPVHRAVTLGSPGLLCRNAYMTLNSIVVHRADKYAAYGIA